MAVDPSMSVGQWIETKPGVFQTRHPRTGQPYGGEFKRQPDGKYVPASLPAKVSTIFDGVVQGGIDMAQGASAGYLGGDMPTTDAGQFGYQAGNFASNSPAGIAGKLGLIFGPRALGKLGITVGDHLAAQRKIDAGIPPAQVFQENGRMFKGPEGSWRRMVDDKKYQAGFEQTVETLRDSNSLVGDYTLGSLLPHKELFEAYPEMKDIKVVFDPTMKANNMGSFNPGTKTLRLNPTKSPTELFGTILHEVQHGIQNKEFWQGGGNAGMFTPVSVQKAAEALESSKKTLAPRMEEFMKESGTSREEFIALSNAYKMERAGTLDKLDEKTKALAQQAIDRGILNDPKARSLIRDSAAFINIAEKTNTEQRKAWKRYQTLQGEAEAREVENQLTNPRFPNREYDGYSYSSLIKRGDTVDGRYIGYSEFDNQITDNPLLGR